MAQTIFAEFQATVSMHTPEGAGALMHPERLRFLLGVALDKLGIQEEIDYTLEVKRVHRDRPNLDGPFEGLEGQEFP
jgi:hypothetical protein